MFWCCAPQEDTVQAKRDVTPGTAQSYPAQINTEVSNNDWGEPVERDEDQFINFAPPPAQYLPPSSSSTGNRARPEELLARAHGGQSSGSAPAISFELILADLESAEQVTYSEAFGSFGPDGSGMLGLDNEKLRRFILDNTAVSLDDLEIELLKAAPECELNQQGFLKVLRENAVAEAQALEQFLGMSQDGERCPAEECRNGLLLFATDRLGANLSEDRWEKVFNAVMLDADVTITMEQWVTYCKRVARVVRLARYARA